MRTIRVGVFETNSSSTHSLTIVPKRDFDLWKAGKMYFDDDSGELVENCTLDDCDYLDSKECGANVCNNYEGCKTARESGLMTYSEWLDDCDEDLETFTETHTVSGVEVVAFGVYGYSG